MSHQGYRLPQADTLSDRNRSSPQIPVILMADVGVIMLTSAFVMLIGYATGLNGWAILGLVFCFVVIPTYITHAFLSRVQKNKASLLSKENQKRYFERQSLRMLLFVAIFCATVLLALASVHFFFLWWGLLLVLVWTIVGFLAAVVVDICLDGRVTHQATDGHERGPRLISQEEAQEEALAQGAGDLLSVPFAATDLPHKSAYTHFLELGTVGAGKSMVLKLLMAVALTLIGKGYGHRALVLEPKGKGEILPFLHSLPLDCPIYNLNPFLSPVVGVDILGAVTDPAVAIRVGEVFVPKDPDTRQPYFSRTGGILLGGVLWAVKTRLKEEATLRHVLLIMRYRHRIEQVLATSPEVHHLVAQHLRTAGETVQSVISETAGKAGMLEPIAAALEKAKHVIDLEDWVQNQESILVLGTSHRRRSVLAAYNRVIITLLSDIILEGEEAAHQVQFPNLRHWFILDEVHALDRVEVIPELLSQGRSKGVCAVLTLHTIGQLQRVYGKEGAAEILSSINNKLFLRVSDPDTEEFIQKEIGVRDLWDSRRSYQYDPMQGKWSWSESEHRETQPLILGSEASDQMLPSKETGIPGFAKIAGIGRYRVTVPGDVIDAHVPSDNGSVSLWYKDTSPKDLILQDLTEREKHRLSIDDSVLEKKKQSSQESNAEEGQVDKESEDSSDEPSGDEGRPKKPRKHDP